VSSPAATLLLEETLAWVPEIDATPQRRAHANLFTTDNSFYSSTPTAVWSEREREREGDGKRSRGRDPTLYKNRLIIMYDEWLAS
jgi:hypothetical protein